MSVLKKVGTLALAISLTLVVFGSVSPVAVEAKPIGPIKICVQYIYLPWGGKICVKWKYIYFPVIDTTPTFPPIGCPKCGLDFDPTLPVINPGPVINPRDILVTPINN
jgi:hypothetical protein